MSWKEVDKRMTHEQLAQLAYDNVLRTLQENEANHPDNEWEKLSYKELREHAINHLVDDIAGDKSEPHPEHALARLTMMLAKR
jgi:Glu-tRNA(Gln) amidotransferase subunit E-like FAD-binding protein